MKLELLERADDAYRQAFRNVLRETYFHDWDPAYLTSTAGAADLEAHTIGRMAEVCERVLPWVNEVYRLAGKTVVEIGCGTGSTAVPFAFSAGEVYAFDTSETSLQSARRRAELLGARNVRFERLDTTWALSDEGVARFRAMLPRVDVVLLCAVLEHLTIDERLRTLRMVWETLQPGGILIVYETPNRLGFIDWHSFLLPFFDSLPDDLALKYSSRSPRAHFGVEEANNVVQLYRLGRGVSFHEFELAIGLEHIDVLNDGDSAYLAQRIELTHPEYDAALRSIFQERLPLVPLGFTKPSLDFVMRKRIEGEPARSATRPRVGHRRAPGSIRPAAPLRYRLADKLNEWLLRLPKAHQALKIALDQLNIG